MTRDITAKKNLESNARLINTVFQEATEGIISKTNIEKLSMRTMQ